MKRALSFVVVISLALIMLLTLTSCMKKSAEDKVTITFWHSMGGPLGESLDNLIEEYNSSQDSIFVDGVSVGNYTALTQKLQASITAGNQPDIAQLYENTTADFIKSRDLCPVQKFINEDKELKSEIIEDFYPVFLRSNTFQDTLWTFPFNKSVRVLYYNKDMFLKYGVDPYDPPETWDEYLDYARYVIAEKDENGYPKVYMTNLNNSTTQLVNLILQAGGEIVDGKEPKFNSPEGVEALRYLRTLLVDLGAAYTVQGFDGQNDFLAEKVLTYEGSSVSMAFMANNDKIKFNIGIAPIPHHRTIKNVISGTNIAIFKSSDKKERGAWNFIKWLTEKEQTAKWSYDTYYMPLRKSALDVEPLKTRLEENNKLFEVYDQLNSAETEPTISEWRKTRKDIEKFVLEPTADNTKDLTDNELMKLLDDVAERLSTSIEKNENRNGE